METSMNPLKELPYLMSTNDVISDLYKIANIIKVF